jgi:hypothetical protein
MRKRAVAKRELARRKVHGRGGVTLESRLLTSDWTADVKSVEAAIGTFTADRALDNECQVVLFELPGDAGLHVNVTHEYPTKAGGYVLNRRFRDTPCGQIVQHIRDMVFSGRPGSKALTGITD